MDRRKLRKWLKEHGVERYFIVVCDRRRHKLLMRGDEEHLLRMVREAVTELMEGDLEIPKDIGEAHYIG